MLQACFSQSFAWRPGTELAPADIRAGWKLLEDTAKGSARRENRDHRADRGNGVQKLDGFCLPRFFQEVSRQHNSSGRRRLVPATRTPGLVRHLLRATGP